MNIFQYFEEEHKFIEERLSELEKNYKNWPAERVFVRATKMFDAIRKHFEKQESLILRAIEDIPALQKSVKDCLADRKQIQDSIDDLVMDHIDSSEFRGNLSKLLVLIRQHINFSDESLYESIRAHVPEETLNSLNESVQEKMFE